MKKILFLVITLLLCVLSFAQERVFTKDNNYGFGTGFLCKDALSYVIPAIDIPSARPSMRDSLFYLKGLQIRKENKERVLKAAQDAVWNIEIISSFSDAVGIELSADNTPELWYLLSEAIQDTDHLIVAIKSKYFRQRPYIRWNEPDDGVADRSRLAETSSSPSGHSGLAATIMSILLEIYPSRAADIIARGKEFISARWILGFHYISDCELGAQIGGYVVNILHSNPSFLAQLDRAKKEAALLSRKGHPCFTTLHNDSNNK